MRLWDMYSEVPLLLGRVPSPKAAAALEERAPARPVSTLEFAWEQGLLITGHEGGEVGGGGANATVVTKAFQPTSVYTQQKVRCSFSSHPPAAGDDPC